MQAVNGFRVSITSAMEDSMLTEGSKTGQHSFRRNPTESLVATFGRVIHIGPMLRSMALSDQFMDLVKILRLLDICNQITAAHLLRVAVANPSLPETAWHQSVSNRVLHKSNECSIHLSSNEAFFGRISPGQ